MPTVTGRSRRQFLKFLSASPLFAAGAFDAFAGDGPVAPPKPSDPVLWAPLQTDKLIKTPKEAIDVFDFEAPCRVNVPPAHFGYMASGIDDEVTLRANREGFLKFQLRPRRLVDVSKIDMSTDILGVKYNSPIVIAPVGGQKSFHADGEVAVARAAKPGNHLQILSTATTSGVEEVTTARRSGLVPAPCVQQLGGGESPGAAGRKGRQSGGRGDGGSFRRPQPGNPVPIAAHRYARLHE